jgi:UDP-N-acetylglucosamine 2-epimerase (non-hydrolysing)
MGREELGDRVSTNNGVNSGAKNVVLCVVGARPNFMKIAPIMRALASPRYAITPRLIHTGQHYDDEMSRRFFEQLGIGQADTDLGVGSGSHAVQTAEIMKRFEPVLDEADPLAVLVVGDVNSTIACALTAVKKGVPIFHVEAGLRSGDRSMPEEINRVLTDQLSDLLFTTERAALQNLVREGIDPSRVHFVGNVMIDTLRESAGRAVPAERTLQGADNPPLFFGEDGFGLLTLHRPSNVDDGGVLRGLLGEMRHLSERLPLVFPMHPRTAARIAAENLVSVIATPRIFSTAPLGYLEMLGLMARARLVLTDSGGIQEETTALGVPCITLRDNTERPITVDEGTNVVVGTRLEAIRAAANEVLESGGKAGRIPEHWDGRAAERIARIIDDWFMARTMESRPGMAVSG